METNFKDEHVSIIVAGKNRTMMTIENIRCLMKHIRHQNYEFVIGSDMSCDGHIQALEYFLKTTGVKYQILETNAERNGLGSLINICNKRAFENSNIVMYVENDLILHKDICLRNYIDDMLSGYIGCINFRYMLPVGKCAYKPFSNGPLKDRYFFHVPLSNKSTFTVFGCTMYCRRYYDLLGPVSEHSIGSELDPEPTMDRRYLELFNSGELHKTGCLMVIDRDHLTEIYNGETAPFYHVGINCQHSLGGKWNPDLTRKEYHIFSDERLDEKFRSLFT